MKHFADRLTEKIRKKNSAICVGLDPRLEKIPNFIKEKALKKNKDKFKAASESIVQFNKEIIDAIFDIVPVVKLQIAFYEIFGEEGIRAFRETVEYARSKDLLIIADVKRNDIGSTAEAYAKAYLGEIDLFEDKKSLFGVDAVTINPFLGWDGVKPFIAECKKNGKGIFILLKTSNPSSGDIQDLYTKDEKRVYEILAHYIESWGADDIGESGYSFVGAVVGATHPKQASELRKIMPNSYFLVPGYGAQGGTADDVKKCFDDEGLGAIINSSRGIIFAYENSDKYDTKSYAQAARDAVIEMNEALTL